MFFTLFFLPEDDEEEADEGLDLTVSELTATEKFNKTNNITKTDKFFLLTTYFSPTNLCKSAQNTSSKL